MEDQYRHIFWCESGTLPIKYLGIPVHYRTPRNAEWHPIENRFASKLGCWRSKLLSYGDRLVLINAVLTSLQSCFLFWRYQLGLGKG
jgi:hypothetical protein